jgi:hypothetical protein
MTLSSKKRSQQQEDRAARKFGGTVNAASGALPIRKNDVRTDTESIELKTTKAKSFSLKHTDLLNAWMHAVRDGRILLFGIQFETESVGQKRWVIMSEDDYLEMRDK